MFKLNLLFITFFSCVAVEATSPVLKRFAPAQSQELLPSEKVIGKVEGLRGEAYINGFPAAVGQLIHVGDKLEVPRAGALRLTFNDTNAFVLNSHSTIRMSEELLRSPPDMWSSLADGLKGSLRFMYHWLTKESREQERKDRENENSAVAGVRG